MVLGAVVTLRELNVDVVVAAAVAVAVVVVVVVGVMMVMLAVMMMVVGAVPSVDVEEAEERPVADGLLVGRQAADAGAQAVVAAAEGTVEGVEVHHAARLGGVARTAGDDGDVEHGGCTQARGGPSVLGLCCLG